MAGSMKEIKLRIRSVESTMQITKAMELVASSKLRRAKERVEGSRPYFETLYETLFDIVGTDSAFDSPYLAKRETNRRLYIVIAGDRGLAGGYNANILKAIEADAASSDYCVLPIGKKAVEHFERRKANVLTTAFAEAGDLSVSDCFEISRLVCQKFLAGAYHSLEEDTSPYGYQGIYGQRDIFGTFSLSTAAQHGRGYVVYAADEIPHAEYRNVLDSRFNYSCPYRFLQYPAKMALENRMSDHGAFRTVWSDLRYGPEVTPPVIKKNDQRNDPPAKAGGSF